MFGVCSLEASSASRHEDTDVGSDSTLLATSQFRVQHLKRQDKALRWMGSI